MRIQCFLTLPKICTCRRSIHPWDTLILLVSIAFCNCDSSSFSFDVECVLTKASAHPYRTDMNFSNKEILFYFPTCTIRKNKLLANQKMKSVLEKNCKLKTNYGESGTTWYFTLKMKKGSRYVLPNHVSSCLTTKRMTHAKSALRHTH
jgi:hypothetical protein